jgi:hypothetical protein
MTGTILTENEAADLERMRCITRGLALAGGVPPSYAAAMDKVADFHASQVTASALLNGKEKEQKP